MLVIQKTLITSVIPDFQGRISTCELPGQGDCCSAVQQQDQCMSQKAYGIAQGMLYFLRTTTDSSGVRCSSSTADGTKLLSMMSSTTPQGLTGAGFTTPPNVERLITWRPVNEVGSGACLSSV